MPNLKDELPKNILKELELYDDEEAFRKYEIFGPTKAIGDPEQPQLFTQNSTKVMLKRTS